MLVLVSFGLVLIATVLLVLGLLVGSGLTLIYLSIALSAIAAIVLIVAVKVAKPKAVSLAAPAPLLPEPERVPVGVGATSLHEGSTAQVPILEASPVPSAPAVPPAGESETEWLAADQDWDETAANWEEDLEFPIAEYDELTEDEILPLLPELYEDEIEVVAERERATKNRQSILQALADLQGGSSAGGVADGGVPVRDYGLPIEDYDQLSVSEIVSVLPELDEVELADVRSYESSNRNRTTIVTNIDRRLGRETAPAQRTVARKAAAKKATAPVKATAKATRAAKAAPAPKAPVAAKKAAAPVKVAAKKAAPAAKRAAPAAKRAAPAAKRAAPAAKRAAPAAKKASAAANRALPAVKSVAKKADAAKKSAPGRKR